MKFDQQPYYVLTFLRENSRGELTVVPANRCEAAYDA
jgi:hypothetical protein